jgi:hypothetical protein
MHCPDLANKFFKSNICWRLILDIDASRCANAVFVVVTCASLLLQQGESLTYVRDQLGHSSIQMTVDVYGHLILGFNRQAVDKLDDTAASSISTETKNRTVYPSMV